jgi:hypothetical protein
LAQKLQRLQQECVMEHRSISWLCAAGVGAGAMFMLDPERGRRRRAVTVDRVLHTTHKLADTAAVTGRDLGHRAKGVVARATSVLRPDHASDQVIEARVRSAIGRVASHPGSVAVAVRDAIVTLDGPVFASEAPRLLSRLARVRGVRSIDNRLSVHDTAGDVPGLQGGPREEPHAVNGRGVWSPTVKLLSSAGTLALISWGAVARHRRNEQHRSVPIFEGPVW